MNLLDSLRLSLKTQREYFNEQGAEIALRDMELTGIVSRIAISIYLLYFAVTFFFFPRLMISPLYALYIPAMLYIDFRARKLIRAKTIQLRAARRLTLIMYALCMMEMILLSVFPHPDLPAVYLPLFLIIGPVLFILPVLEELLITVSGAAAFIVLVVLYKPASLWQHELFETVTALVMAICAILLMTRTRIQTETLKDQYFVMSRHDALTGIQNKAAGLTAAEQYLHEFRKPRKRFAVFFVDLDDFKKINDTYGHIEGDRLLRKIGAVLKSVCRKDDIVCRFGGDEFLILIKDLSGEDTAARKAEQILAALQNLSGREKYAISCSIGICYVAEGRGEIESYIRKADQALYAAKNKGKNHFELLFC